jgi:hypothetical protein
VKDAHDDDPPGVRGLEEQHMPPDRHLAVADA